MTEKCPKGKGRRPDRNTLLDVGFRTDAVLHGVFLTRNLLVWDGVLSQAGGLFFQANVALLRVGSGFG